jgi:hypothetical protein
MGQYRDDLDAAHQRIAALEADVARLEHNASHKNVNTSTVDSVVSESVNGVKTRDLAREERRAELKRRARGPDIKVPLAPWYERSPRTTGIIVLGLVALIHALILRLLVGDARAWLFVAASGLTFSVAAYPIFRGAVIIANPSLRYKVRTEYGLADETYSRSFGAASLFFGLLCDALGLAFIVKLALPL